MRRPIKNAAVPGRRYGTRVTAPNRCEGVLRLGLVRIEAGRLYLRWAEKHGWVARKVASQVAESAFTVEECLGDHSAMPAGTRY
jgi:hypothetical protein